MPPTLTDRRRLDITRKQGKNLPAETPDHVSVTDRDLKRGKKSTQTGKGLRPR